MQRVSDGVEEFLCGMRHTFDFYFVVGAIGPRTYFTFITMAIQLISVLSYSVKFAATNSSTLDGWEA